MRPTGNETGAMMSSTAIDLALRHAVVSCTEREAAVVPCTEREAASRGGGACAPITLSGRLLAYWSTELPRPVAARRQSLEDVCRRVRQGVAPVSDVLPFALGDTDDDIVYRATVAHLAPGLYAEVQPGPLREAVDWIRRHLALNRAAVFAALLSIGDEGVLELLRPLRSVLEERDGERLRCTFAACSSAPIAEFVRSWGELHAQSVSAPVERRAPAHPVRVSRSGYPGGSPGKLPSP